MSQFPTDEERLRASEDEIAMLQSQLSAAILARDHFSELATREANARASLEAERDKLAKQLEDIGRDMSHSASLEARLKDALRALAFLNESWFNDCNCDDLDDPVIDSRDRCLHCRLDAILSQPDNAALMKEDQNETRT